MQKQTNINNREPKGPFKNLNYAQFLPNFKEERTQKFTTIVLTVLALSFFGIFAINPTISTIAQLRKELDDNTIVDNKLQEKINNLSILQKKYVSLENDLPLILSAVPKNSDVPLLAAQVQAVAKNSNVSINNFQSFEVDVVTNPSPKSYSSFAFALSVDGAYNDLYKFLSSLSNMQRVLSIDLISLTKKTASNGIELSIRGKAFFSP